MSDFELESKLKSVRVPEKTDEYWEDFPGRVRSQLRRPAIVERTRTHWMPQWAWSSGLAAACVVLCLSLWPAFQTVVKDERTIQQDAARFPHQLHLLMADEHGMQYLVSE
ncbi:MAG TPA: hypothetical protein VNU95_16325 [Candidatus Acidoferrales bacterium]|jgi:hypothetical protein|nr:hypothetical protein [Candidatus Acidoferrales bacterium]